MKILPFFVIKNFWEDSVIKQILIVGGGTSGWMAAACFAKMLKPLGVGITLVESSEIGTVGVGEATIPPILGFLKLLGIDETDFIRSTQASFKLGIQFADWRQLGSSYWHQFGTVGANIDGFEFYQHWLKSKKHGNQSDFTDYAPSIVMAQAKKFARLNDNTQSPFCGANYALHFDASLVARYLRDYSEVRGVERLDGKIQRVHLNDDANIKSVELTDGRNIHADFFIDCSGFKALLIEGALHTGYEDWSHYLPCNSAVVAQTENVEAPAPYTKSTALTYGWQWKIPLQHRSGNGYVFCNSYTSDDEAEALFRSNLVGEILTSPRFLRFTTGKRKKLWNKNCVAVGLASGFLEPLESTSIHLAMKAILKLVEMFPSDLNDMLPTQCEYNRIMGAEYESVRDFIVLHYCTTDRTDTEFWRACRALKIPESLHERIELFKVQGRLYKDEFDLFTANSWYAVLEGMGVRPRGYDPLVDHSDVIDINRRMDMAIQVMRIAVNSLPSHERYIELNCPAKVLDFVE